MLADRYDILDLLGQGSFGQVFRARDRILGIIVAIKVLHRQDDDALRRFHREAVVLHSQLANDFVIKLLDHAGLNAEDPYLVLEFCELRSLRSWVGASRNWRDVAAALLHAARGLVGLHAANGFHRDIKPENMLVARVSNQLGWQVKLADFGLAGYPHPVTGAMTRSPAGTDGYIAPEIVAGARFDAPADIYSLGVVGIELLVGRIDIASLGACGAPAGLVALLQSMVRGVAAVRPTAPQVAATLECLLNPPELAVPVPIRPTRPPVPSEALNLRTEDAATAFLKGAAAVGLGAALVGIVGRIFGGSGKFYDPSVDRNRGQDGRFRR
jgi:serine/threonine protein kinase